MIHYLLNTIFFKNRYQQSVNTTCHAFDMAAPIIPHPNHFQTCFIRRIKVKEIYLSRDISIKKVQWLVQF